MKLPTSPPSWLDFLTTEEVARLLAEAEQRALAQEPQAVLGSSCGVAIARAVRFGLHKGEIFGLSTR